MKLFYVRNNCGAHSHLWRYVIAQNRQKAWELFLNDPKNNYGFPGWNRDVKTINKNRREHQATWSIKKAPYFKSGIMIGGQVVQRKCRASVVCRFKKTEGVLEWEDMEAIPMEDTEPMECYSVVSNPLIYVGGHERI